MQNFARANNILLTFFNAFLMTTDLPETILKFTSQYVLWKTTIVLARLTSSHRGPRVVRGDGDLRQVSAVGHPDPGGGRPRHQLRRRRRRPRAPSERRQRRRLLVVVVARQRNGQRRGRRQSGRRRGHGLIGAAEAEGSSTADDAVVAA
jgi:hypothetical protein